jgi:hypothetical protein
MRVGVIQSNYLPWRGYFDFIASVELFVLYDDVQYSSGTWRNRNKVKTPNGVKWLTVPVKNRLGLAIDETEIEYAHPWQEQHRGLLQASLRKSPFFPDAMALWEAGIRDNPPTISELNTRLLKLICEHLQIATPLVPSRPYRLTGAKTERLISLLKRLGATSYISGPAASSYLDERMFEENGISLEYKSYDYPPYPQPFGEFVGDVSILDLIANTGPQASSYLRSLRPNRSVATCGD